MVDRMGEDFKPHVTTGKLSAIKSSNSIVSALTSLLILDELNESKRNQENSHRQSLKKIVPAISLTIQGLEDDETTHHEPPHLFAN